MFDVPCLRFYCSIILSINFNGVIAGLIVVNFYAYNVMYMRYFASFSIEKYKTWKHKHIVKCVIYTAIANIFTNKLLYYVLFIKKTQLHTFRKSILHNKKNIIILNSVSTVRWKEIPLFSDSQCSDYNNIDFIHIRKRKCITRKLTQIDTF